MKRQSALAPSADGGRRSARRAIRTAPELPVRPGAGKVLGSSFFGTLANRRRCFLGLSPALPMATVWRKCRWRRVTPMVCGALPTTEGGP